MRNQNGFIGVLIIIFLVVAFLTIPVFYVFGTQQDRVVTIRGKERIVNSDNSYYLIFAEEGEFKNVDSFLRTKFDSSSLYNKLEEGQKYECDTYGWRIPFFSQYPNLVDCEKK